MYSFNGMSVVFVFRMKCADVFSNKKFPSIAVAFKHFGSFHCYCQNQRYTDTLSKLNFGLIKRYDFSGLLKRFLLKK